MRKTVPRLLPLLAALVLAGGSLLRVADAGPRPVAVDDDAVP